MKIFLANPTLSKPIQFREPVGVKEHVSGTIWLPPHCFFFFFFLVDGWCQFVFFRDHSFFKPFKFNKESLKLVGALEESKLVPFLLHFSLILWPLCISTKMLLTNPTITKSYSCMIETLWIMAHVFFVGIVGIPKPNHPNLILLCTKLQWLHDFRWYAWAPMYTRK